MGRILPRYPARRGDPGARPRDASAGGTIPSGTSTGRQPGRSAANSSPSSGEVTWSASAVTRRRRSHPSQTARFRHGLFRSASCRSIPCGETTSVAPQSTAAAAAASTGATQTPCTWTTRRRPSARATAAVASTTARTRRAACHWPRGCHGAETAATVTPARRPAPLITAPSRPACWPVMPTGTPIPASPSANCPTQTGTPPSSSSVLETRRTRGRGSATVEIGRLMGWHS